MRLKNYIEKSIIIDEITYDVYCAILEDKLDENIFSNIKDKALEYLKVLKPIKDLIQKIASDFKIGITEIIKAFKERSIFNFLKALKFNIIILFRAITETGKLVRQGLFKIFERISKNKYIEKLRNGVMKIDDFFNEHPLLKKVTGIVVAGILIYIWLSMTFIGDLDYDFNWSDIIAALMGSFTLTDMFLSPSGLMMMTLFVTGGLISFPWLGSSIYNLVVALTYTGYKMIRDRKDNEVLKKLKRFIKRG